MLSDDCPQINITNQCVANVQELTVERSGPTIKALDRAAKADMNKPQLCPVGSSLHVSTYNGWKISQYGITAQLTSAFSGDIIRCHKGNHEGQNPNYSYCGAIEYNDYMAYIEKTSMNSDGTIGKTLRKTFYNIYDNEGKFIKTVCGDDPDVVAERGVKQLVKEIGRGFGS